MNFHERLIRSVDGELTTYNGVPARYCLPGWFRDWYRVMPIDFSRVTRNEEEIKSGVCLYTESFCPEAPGIYKVCDGNRVRVSDDSDEFFALQVFLDHFRDAGMPLPDDIDPNELFRFWVHCLTKYTPPEPKLFKRLMEIMISPLNTYDDLISAIKLYDSATGKHVLDTKKWDGSRLFSGDVVDWTPTPDDCSNDGRHEVKKLNENCYSIAFWERGTRIPYMIFYGVQYLYEYILNYYCEIVK